MVGVAGLEPAASWSRTKRDTNLRHTPKALTYYTIPGGGLQAFFSFLPVFPGRQREAPGIYRSKLLRAAPMEVA